MRNRRLQQPALPRAPRPAGPEGGPTPERRGLHLGLPVWEGGEGGRRERGKLRT